MEYINKVNSLDNILRPKLDSHDDFVIENNKLYAEYEQFDRLNLMYPIIIEERQWQWEFYSGNVIKSKQHIYLQGILYDKSAHIQVSSPNNGLIWNTSADLRAGPDSNLLAILLADDRNLLNRFINWPYDPIDRDNSNRLVIGPVLVIKALIGGNLVRAQEELDKYQADLGNKKNDKYFIVDIPILESMMEGDIVMFKESIQPLLDVKFLKRRRSFGHKIMELLAVEAAYFIKAMWILGHEVVIDHPLIPMDLMPIEPLAEYPVPYFFLDGYKGELPENYVKWLAMTPEERESQSQDSMTEQKLPSFDPDKYSTPTEQRMIEACMSKGLIVKGDKDSGWKIYKDI